MTVKVERLGHHGDGIAIGPVYVPLSLPGEEVEGAIIEGRMVAPKIVTPSPDRVSAPCSHFKSCGGCGLQHASDGFVADWKSGVVKAALEAHGLSAPIRRVLTSPSNSRRRATLSGRRTKKGALVGFHGRASSTLVAIDNCKTLHPDILALIPTLQQLVVIGASRKAEVSLAVTVSDAGADVVVTGGKPLDLSLRQDLAAAMGVPGLARLTWDQEVLGQQSPPYHLIGETKLTPPPGAFLQATKQAESALNEAVAEAVGEAKFVADLFAGCGTFSLPLARMAEVHAVESDAEMLRALDDAWRNATGLKRVTTQARDLFRRPLVVSELNRFEAVVIDPPRAGAEAQTAEIAASEVPRIASVSCNPVTFARDSKTLIDGGYRLDWVDVIDQFRWSTHVEVAARFSRL